MRLLAKPGAALFFTKEICLFAIPSVSSEELPLLHFVPCVSRIHCHGYSFLSSSYLCRIERKEILLAAPAVINYRIGLTSSIVSHLSLFGVPLALLLPPLISGSDLGA